MTRSEIRLRLLTGEDADWVAAVDSASAGNTARGHAWHVDKLRASLDEGVWATEERIAWAITDGGKSVGFALATDLDSGTGTLEIRILPGQRGRGVGRAVLRLLADHHFAEDPSLVRITGKTHEANVPMQRAFVASGFRMEARFRGSFEQPDGTFASEWGYALTRDDWESGDLAPSTMFDLHARRFVVATPDEGPNESASLEAIMLLDRVVVKVLQEGRRVLARYDGGAVHDGEAAGLLLDDVLRLQFAHHVEVRGGDPVSITGHLRGRIQPLGDGRLEILATFSPDGAVGFDLHLVEPSKSA